MDDFEIEIDEVEAELAAKKKKRGESDAASISHCHEVSSAAQQAMRQRGLTIQQISQILREWKQLDAKELASAMVGFATDTARASAHLVVDFVSVSASAIGQRGFALITNFLHSCQHLADLVKNPNAENRERIRREFGLKPG